MRSLLIGLLGVFAVGAALAQPTPTPTPRPKAAVPAPPAAVQGAPKAPAQSETTQSSSGSSFFPFKLPGFGQSGTTTQFDANQRALIDKVNMYLMSVTTLAGDFVQVGPDGRRAEGKLYLQKPGRIRFEYNDPSPIELVADGSSVVVRDRKLMTQDLYPLSQTPLRFLLADRIDLLKETNVLSVSADDTFLSLQIEEKQTLGGTHKVLMMFSVKDTQLKQWTITDPQGYDTTVALYNLETPKKLDPQMFVITYERKEFQ
jgi:outer membrane lipoprotein-sorting protein